MTAVKPTAEDYEKAMQDFCESLPNDTVTRLVPIAVVGEIVRRAESLASHRQPESALDGARNARRVAPWADFAGNSIHEGDTIEHPTDHMRGIVFVLESETDPNDRWRVLYDAAFNPGRVSRLCLQIGNKGQAVVVSAPTPNC